MTDGSVRPAGEVDAWIVTIGYLLTLLRTACMTFPISRVSVPPVIGRNHAVNDRGGSLTPKWLNGGGT